jgi:hypothetical protein
VNVSVGWYKSWGDLPDYIQDIYEGVGVTPWELGFWRDGGHAMTMAAATISGPAREIGLRDPADPNDGQLDSQSAFLTNERAVDEMFAKFDGEYRTHDRIPSFNSKAFIDRITTIAPLDGLAADQQTIKLIGPFPPRRRGHPPAGADHVVRGCRQCHGRRPPPRRRQAPVPRRRRRRDLAARRRHRGVEPARDRGESHADRRRRARDDGLRAPAA